MITLVNKCKLGVGILSLAVTTPLVSVELADILPPQPFSVELADILPPQPFSVELADILPPQPSMESSDLVPVYHDYVV